ncbi:hypothetical protein MRX96_029027 [Rhipicephalus microplus]
MVVAIGVGIVGVVHVGVVVTGVVSVVVVVIGVVSVGVVRVGVLDLRVVGVGLIVLDVVGFDVVGASGFGVDVLGKDVECFGVEEGTCFGVDIIVIGDKRLVLGVSGAGVGGAGADVLNGVVLELTGCISVIFGVDVCIVVVESRNVADVAELGA